MTVHGVVAHLVAGEYAAEVAQVGSTLLSLRHRGRDLVHPVEPGRLDEAWQGRTLVPWPNRVVDGRYTAGGTAYQLPVNEPATGSALHGLGAFQAWEQLWCGPSDVVWELALPASYGYPFEITCRTTWSLHPTRGLSLVVEGRNDGPTPAPFGASTHPYLTCGTDLDACTLTLPAAEVLLVDEAVRPTRVVGVAEAGLDLRHATALAGRAVDHAFTGLPAAGWDVELRGPDGGVVLSGDAPWVQVYTGERIGRRGLAVEPMTCPPDAFNSDPDGVSLAPGETRSLSLTIAATD